MPVWMAWLASSTPLRNALRARRRAAFDAADKRQAVAINAGTPQRAGDQDGAEEPVADPLVIEGLPVARKIPAVPSGPPHHLQQLATEEHGDTCETAMLRGEGSETVQMLLTADPAAGARHGFGCRSR